MIRGRVVDALGQPVALAAIYVISAPEPQRDISQLSGADGSFALAANAPGTYVIGARADEAGEGRTSLIVSSGDQDVPAQISLNASV